MVSTKTTAISMFQDYDCNIGSKLQQHESSISQPINNGNNIGTQQQQMRTSGLIAPLRLLLKLLVEKLKMKTNQYFSAIRGGHRHLPRQIIGNLTKLGSNLHCGG